MPSLPDIDRIGLFDRPTSVYLRGDNRALLNWVAYGLASENRGGFVWTDIQLDGEVREPDDLLGTDRIPPDRFFEIPPVALVADEFTGNVALGGLLRTDDDGIRRLVDFLRLPAHARDLIAQYPQDEYPTILIVSNGQRMSALHSERTVRPALRSIIESGVSILVTWADAPTLSRSQFEYVFHLGRNEVSRWQDTVLRVEKGTSGGPLPTGTELRLQDYPEVASVLQRSL